MEIKDYTYNHPWLAKSIAFILLFPTIFGSLWAFFEPLDPFGVNVLERLGIWGYIGLLIVSFLITIVIVVFFIKKPRRTLRKIETVLHKDEDLEPEFFRKAGPLWADFKGGYIFRRDEVDEIINKLNEKPIQVVEGGPASGKSVLLKNIGFDLKKSGYEVFYIDCKFEREEDINTYIKEVLKVDNAKTLLIIDDYHLKKDVCEHFLEQYQNRGIRETKVLIGTRPLGEEGAKRRLEIQYLNTTKITSESVSQNIINEYLKKQFDLNDEVIRDFSLSFSKYERDLWYLSWALKEFNPGEGAIKTNIYENIKNSILKIKDSAEDVEDIFLPLSILNRFEIPMEKRILTNREYGLGIEKKEIDNLIEQNEIVQTKVTDSKERTALALHHSSLAELNYETYRNTELGEDFKDRFEIYGDGDFEECFLLYYLIHSDLLYYIDTTSLDFQDFFMGIILQNLSNDGLKKKIQRAIQHNIDSNKELEGIELYLYGYLTVLPTDFVAELVKELNIDKLARRINETDDGGRNSSFFGTTQGPFLKKIVGQINLEKLRLKVMNDICVISSILGALSNTDKDITRDFVHKLGVSHIKELFSRLQISDEFDPIRSMPRCYGMIAVADDTLTNELLEIIKDRVQYLSLMEIKNFIFAVSDQAALYSNSHILVATEALLDAIEEIIKTKIRDEGDSEAAKDFKDYLCYSIPNWNEELREFAVKMREKFDLISQG